MSTRKNKPPLALEMDFDEALRRFARVEPKELPDNVLLKRRGPKSPLPILKKRLNPDSGCERAQIRSVRNGCESNRTQGNSVCRS